MSHRTSTQRRTWKERALSLLLTAALVAGMVPGLTLSASAEHWADAYLDQLVDWGVMRADQTDNPDAALTRAEFFAVINRAYGYTETGYIPFEDVLPTDWFYDDISIAYTAGYMAGTSETTASPNDPLTREQAFCILGRNMMLKDAPGESLAFSDSRDVSDWARGTIKAAADNYIISGYPDNTLHPQDSISKGQMAVLISQCIGTPIQESGAYDLGGVFGNVTITAPNVTLRNATISGDLYISGGVGLGGIKLENVDVLGRIIVSGTGESEGGSASIIMRNVTAEEMLVDNMRNKTVTVRADGITDIAKTIVRTNAYLEDNNTDDKGLMHIEVDGDPGLRLTLAGRIKEVVNKTPSSYIQAAKGTVAKLTVDEAATNSTVQIDRNTKINELNLDVATSVLGDGDIGQLNINAPGSVVTMLPDKIYIRPGLTASIAGVIMDYQAAEEGSLDPRLLSGYPAAKDIAPTGFRADFAGNKKGTIYWAVSYVSDGSIGEDDLISPPSYGSKAIANGSVAEPAGGDEVSAQVGNLVVGGSYYLSAILVDEQKERSPVKVISFSTPDNTVPAFGQGYPYMSRTTCNIAQVTVMPTKSCKLYYALLPQGAKAPTANEMKAAAVTGNLGYGVRDVTKNTEEVFTVNSQRLEELKTYVLYLWLTDVDGANSSTVQSLTFTIPDETPPVVDPIPYSVSQGTTGNTIAMRTGMNERGTIFWAVVPHGEPYPLPNMAEPLGPDNVVSNGEAVSARLDSMYAKLGVQGGRGALISGSVAVANPDAEVSFNVTGLVPETAYDLYYVGRDAANNYSAEVKMVTINTLDTSGPIVTLYFVNPDKSTTEATGLPPANASIVLDFSERITVDSTTDLLAMDRGLLVERLQLDFVLHQIDPMNPSKEMELIDVTGKGDEKNALKQQAIRDGNTWIDYDEIVVRESRTEQGHIEVVFEYNKAIAMMSGRTYYFSLDGIKDTSGNYPPGANGTEIKVPLTPTNTANTAHTLPRFTTAFASVSLNNTGSLPEPVWAEKYGAKKQAMDGMSERNGYQPTRIDTFFTVTPESTAGITDETYYDIVLFADKAVGYDLYYRIVDTTNRNTPLTSANPGKNLTLDDGTNTTQFDHYKLPARFTKLDNEGNGWIYLGNYDSIWSRTAGKAVSAVNKNFNQVNMNYPQLNRLGEDLRYDFAISVTSVEGDDRHAAWNGEVNFDVYVMAGAANTLDGAIGSYPPEYYSQTLGLQSVGTPNPPGYVTATARFTDSLEPTFRSGNIGNPSIAPGDTYAMLKFELNPTGSTLYYRIAPVDNPIPATLNVLHSAGGVATGPVFSASGKNSDFYKIIEAQTQHGVDNDGRWRGQLYNSDWTTVTEGQTGQLWYYQVDDGAAKTLRRAIANMNNSYSGNFPGYEVYDESYGPKTVRIPDANGRDTQLQPDTDYYLYIVLESSSGNQDSLSQVYIYTFHTAKTAKPKLSLTNNQNGTVAIETQVSTALNYIMVTPTELKDTLFTATDYNWVKTGTTLSSSYANYTVLQAMLTPYLAVATSGTNPPGQEYVGYSVFDAYASDLAKGQIANLIRERFPGDAILGSATVNANDPVDRPTTTAGMRPGEDYYFIAVGYNTASAQGPLYDTFGAVERVRVPNRDIPYVVSISTTAERTGGSNSYKGSVTITFSDLVYWVPGVNSTAAIPVTDTKTSSGSGNGWISILDDLGGSVASRASSPNSAPVSANAARASRSYTLDFDSIGINATLIMFNYGRIANSSGYSSGDSLQFMFIEDQDKIIRGESGLEINGYGYSFTVTWTDSTGTHTVKG